MTKDELAKNWQGSKSKVMLRICKDLAFGELSNLKIPKYINSVLKFLDGEEKVDED